MADVKTIAISYFLMFLYIALFLGSFARKLILAFYGLFAGDEKTEKTKVFFLSVCVCVHVCLSVRVLVSVYLSV